LSILCLVPILHVSLVCPSCVLSQYCVCLWFVHSVSCLNTPCLWFVHYVSCPNNACVSCLSFPCPVSVMPVYGLSILCVLYQCCMYLVCQITLSCLNTAYVSGLSILCLVSILPVSLVCTLCFLSQYCMCRWFIHQVSSLNIACVAG
jgi:hypothetical protein